MNTLQNLILSNEDETLNREVKAYQEKLKQSAVLFVTATMSSLKSQKNPKYFCPILVAIHSDIHSQRECAKLE